MASSKFESGIKYKVRNWNVLKFILPDFGLGFHVHPIFWPNYFQGSGFFVRFDQVWWKTLGSERFEVVRFCQIWAGSKFGIFWFDIQHYFRTCRAHLLHQNSNRVESKKASHVSPDCPCARCSTIQLLCAPTTVLPGGLDCSKAFAIQKARTLMPFHSQ